MRQRRTNGQKQAGFVLTVELILISTILIIGCFAGLVTIRDALIKHKSSLGNQQMVVADANGTILGQVMGFDEHDAPIIPLIDRTANDDTGRAYRALLSIRDDRFTSREAVYYSGANCTGIPCVKRPSDEDTDSQGISGVGSTGVTSYIYKMQGSSVYAVGNDPLGVKGHLYRGTLESCPVGAGSIQSRYLSEKVVSGKPCDPIAFADASEAKIDCIADIGQTCGCPAGYQDEGDVIGRYSQEIDRLLESTLAPLKRLGLTAEVNVGEICCPVGATLDDDGDLVNAVVYAVAYQLLETSDDLPAAVNAQLKNIVRKLYEPLRCVSSAQFVNAVPVSSPDNPARNVLSEFTSPFSISLPDTVNADGSSWVSRPTSDTEGF